MFRNVQLNDLKTVFEEQIDNKIEPANLRETYHALAVALTSDGRYFTPDNEGYIYWDDEENGGHHSAYFRRLYARLQNLLRENHEFSHLAHDPNYDTWSLSVQNRETWIGYRLKPFADAMRDCQAARAAGVEPYREMSDADKTEF